MPEEGTEGGVFLRTNIYPGGPGGKKRNEEEEEGRPKKGGGEASAVDERRATSDERKGREGTGTDNHAGLVLYWDEAITLPRQLTHQGNRRNK